MACYKQDSFGYMLRYGQDSRCKKRSTSHGENGLISAPTAWVMSSSRCWAKNSKVFCLQTIFWPMITDVGWPGWIGAALPNNWESIALICCVFCMSMGWMPPTIKPSGCCDPPWSPEKPTVGTGLGTGRSLRHLDQCLGNFASTFGSDPQLLDSTPPERRSHFAAIWWTYSSLYHQFTTATKSFIPLATSLWTSLNAKHVPSRIRKLPCVPVPALPWYSSWIWWYTLALDQGKLDMKCYMACPSFPSICRAIPA